MRRFIGFFALFLGVFAMEMRAQSTNTGDPAFALLRHPVTSGAEYARCLRENDRSCLRATRAEILTAWQMAHKEYEFKTWEDVANRLDALIYAPCRAGYFVKNMARIHIPSRKVDINWSRPVQDGEYCLADNNTGLFVASASCGNPFPDRMPYTPARTTQNVSLNELQILKDSIRSLKDSVSKLTDNLAVARRAPASRVVPQAKLLLRVADSVRIQARGGFDQLYMKSTEDIDFGSVLISIRVDTTKRKSHVVRDVLTHTAAATLGALIGGMKQNVTVNQCDAVVGGGGPINPPNIQSLLMMSAWNGSPSKAETRRGW